MKRYYIAIIVLLFTSVASGQNPNIGPNDSFAWDQAAPNQAAVEGYVFKYYLDGAVTGSVWSAVVCTGSTSPFTCQAKTPQFSPGTHTITITAANSTGESAPSVPFAFVFGNPPTIPNNIRVIKAPQ